MPRFFFHENSAIDAVGLKMSGLPAAKRHATGLEAASRVNGHGALPWQLRVMDEKSTILIALARPGIVKVK